MREAKFSGSILRSITRYYTLLDSNKAQDDGNKKANIFWNPAAF